jgi:hypothetical protein
MDEAAQPGCLDTRAHARGRTRAHTHVRRWTRAARARASLALASPHRAAAGAAQPHGLRVPRNAPQSPATCTLSKVPGLPMVHRGCLFFFRGDAR